MVNNVLRVIEQNDELAISFQVGSRNPYNSEQYTIDFYINSPQGQTVLKKTGLDHGDENHYCHIQWEIFVLF